MKKILMCPPAYYDIEYEINPWMNVHNKVDKQKAKQQYESLKNVYKNLGVEVLEIGQGKGLPDMVYIANIGHYHNGTFIKANFRYPQRRGESALAQAYFEKQLHCKTAVLPENVFFEGQGDLLKSGSKYLLGWGKRSSREAKEFVEKVLGQPVISLETIDAYYYHLDMCLGPLSDESVIVNPKSFTPEGLAELNKNFSTVVEISQADAHAMACNLVCVDKTIVMAAGVSADLKKKLEDKGYSIQEVEMGEYIKGGGSVKCVTFEF